MEKIEEYKRVVRLTWTKVEAAGDAPNQLFHKRLNELDSSVALMFKDSVQSESGATPFFELIRLTVKKIDDFESLVPILQSAGKYQRKIGVRTKHFDSVGGSFLYSMEQTLGKTGDLAWTKPVKEAWTWIFVFIAKVMQPGDDDETRKKATVRRTWTLFEKSNSQAQFADLMFKTLFDVDSNIAALFKNSDMAAHQSKFISTITLILSLLDDKDRLVQTLTQLGKAHSGLGLELAHYKTFGDVLLRCLMMTMGAEFNNEVRDAWTWLYSIMAKLMMSDSANASKKKQSIENAAAAAKAAAPAAVSPVASSAKTETPKETSPPAQSPVKAAPAAEPQALNSTPVVTPQLASPKKIAPAEAAPATASIAPESPAKVAPSETKAEIKPAISPAAAVEPVSSPVKSISAAPVAVQSVPTVQSVPVPEVIAPTPEPMVVQVPLENVNVVPTVSPTAAAPTLREPEVDPATLPPADQATEVHRTWGVFQSLLPSVQATLFANTLRMLNRTAPATASLFDGMDIDSHSAMFVEAIGKVVSMLDDHVRALDSAPSGTKSELEKYLSSLGRRHVKYGLTAVHAEAFLVAFLTGIGQTVGSTYGSMWSRRSTAAWTWLMNNVVLKHMLPPPGTTVAAVRAELLAACWASLSSDAKRLRSFFADVFTEASAKDQEIAGLLKGVDMDAHNESYRAAVAKLIGALNDLDSLKPYLIALGRRHALYGVTEVHFSAFVAAFMAALKKHAASAIVTVVDNSADPVPVDQVKKGAEVTQPRTTQNHAFAAWLWLLEWVSSHMLGSDWRLPESMVPAGIASIQPSLWRRTLGVRGGAVHYQAPGSVSGVNSVNIGAAVQASLVGFGPQLNTVGVDPALLERVITAAVRSALTSVLTTARLSASNAQGALNQSSEFPPPLPPPSLRLHTEADNPLLHFPSSYRPLTVPSSTSSLSMVGLHSPLASASTSMLWSSRQALSSPTSLAHAAATTAAAGGMTSPASTGEKIIVPPLPSIPHSGSSRSLLSPKHLPSMLASGSPGHSLGSVTPTGDDTGVRPAALSPSFSTARSASFAYPFTSSSLSTSAGSLYGPGSLLRPGGALSSPPPASPSSIASPTSKP